MDVLNVNSNNLKTHIPWEEFEMLGTVRDVPDPMGHDSFLSVTSINET